jgi:hypothetical protein
VVTSAERLEQPQKRRRGLAADFDVATGIDTPEQQIEQLALPDDSSDQLRHQVDDDVDLAALLVFERHRRGRQIDLVHHSRGAVLAQRRQCRRRRLRGLGRRRRHAGLGRRRRRRHARLCHINVRCETDQTRTEEKEKKKKEKENSLFCDCEPWCAGDSASVDACVILLTTSIARMW